MPVLGASRTQCTAHTLLHSMLSRHTCPIVGGTTAPDLQRRLAMEEAWMLDSGAGTCQAP